MTFFFSLSSNMCSRAIHLFARTDVMPTANAAQRKSIMDLLQKAGNGVTVHTNAEVDLKQRTVEHSTYTKFEGKALLDRSGKEVLKPDLVLWFVGGKVSVLFEYFCFFRF
jgi:hypothetical protein